VIEVRGTVEQGHLIDRLDGGDDLLYDLGAAGFGEIGDTLNEGGGH
jgi:hypothetical protein